MLSAIITTRDSAKHLDNCLRSINFADEIIVVDSGSTDRTVAIAKKRRARVIFNKWSGFGPQKNFGTRQARGDWLLFIDADEIVSTPLAREITAAIKSLQYDFYWLKITTLFLNKKLSHLYGHNLRLFKKSAGRWNNARVHEQVVKLPGGRYTHNSNRTLKLGDPDTANLNAHLLHYSHPTIESYLKKMRLYSSLDAQQMASSNKHRSGRPVAPSLFLPLRLALRQFIKLLLYRRGFLDGYPGFMWCLLSAYYEYQMGKKYLGLQKQPIPKPQRPNT